MFVGYLTGLRGERLLDSPSAAKERQPHEKSISIDEQDGQDLFLSCISMFNNHWEEVFGLRDSGDLKLKGNEKAAIREATRILKERFPVKEVILFGSKARGDSDQESDIDLLLLTTKPIHWKERHEIVYALFDVEMKHDVVISIIVNTLHDWNDGICTVLPIHEEINREGVAMR